MVYCDARRSQDLKSRVAFESSLTLEELLMFMIDWWLRGKRVTENNDRRRLVNGSLFLFEVVLEG